MLCKGFHDDFSVSFKSTLTSASGPAPWTTEVALPPALPPFPHKHDKVSLWRCPGFKTYTRNNFGYETGYFYPDYTFSFSFFFFFFFFHIGKITLYDSLRFLGSAKKLREIKPISKKQVICYDASHGG